MGEIMDENASGHTPVVNRGWVTLLRRRAATRAHVLCRYDGSIAYLSRAPTLVYRGAQFVALG